MKTKLSPFGQIVWEDRYGLKNDKGELIEKDISETFFRAASEMASKEKESDLWVKKFYEIMLDHYFCPAGRILAHSGTHYSQLFNCFVIPFENDSLEGIMDTAKKMATIFKFGGGVGFNYSTLRPNGAYIKGVNGHSCGVPGFVHMMSTVSEVIEQGGSRRAASLGLLEVSHPDIWEFVSYKNDHNWDRLMDFVDVKDQGKWQAFKFENLYKWQMYNVSVGVSDEFFVALGNKDPWPLYWKGEEWELYTVLFKKFLPDNTYKTITFEVTANDASTALWKVKHKIPFPTAKDKFEVKSPRKIMAEELWTKICYNAWADGCPGLINLSTSRKMHNLEYASPILTTNPCLHGDSLVAVADGRNAVSIRRLAEEGKDVPVYCRNREGKVTIRMMRNPRVTGYNKKIYIIKLDDGSIIKATGNHELKLSDGLYVSVSNLKYGDSLHIMTKKSASFHEMVERDNCKSTSLKKYYWIGNKPEHRMIYEFYKGPIKRGQVIHHKNFKTKDNKVENLDLMSVTSYNALHAVEMVGDLNPMRRASTEWSKEEWSQYKENMSNAVSGEKNGRFGGISNTKLFDIAVDLTKKTGRKLSCTEWRKIALKNNWPSQFSPFRVKAFGTVANFLEKAASKVGAKGSGIRHAELRDYKKFLTIVEETDLDVFFENGQIQVRKICENCGKPFTNLYYRREICYCSHWCSTQQFKFSASGKKSMRKAHSDIREKKRLRQINAFNDLKLELGRIPLKRELTSYCKKKGLPFRLPTKKEIAEKGHIGTFSGGYTELKEVALSYNHRVISVECSEEGTVYNGTVDEFHNFYFGAFKGLTNGEDVVFTNGKNCGEQILPAFGSCNLSSIVLSSFVKEGQFDYDELRRVVGIAVRFADNVIDSCSFPIPEIGDMARKERRVGIGTMGTHDVLIACGLSYDSQEGRDFIKTILEVIRDTAYDTSMNLSLEKGSFPLYDRDKFMQSGFIKTLPAKLQKKLYKTGIRNSALLTQAPTGSTAALFGASSGCEPWFTLSFTRNTRLGSYEDGCPAYIAWEEKNQNSEKPTYFKTAQEISPEDHIKMLQLFSQCVDSSVSKTVNLSNSATVEDVKSIFLMAMENGVKGITIFRDGSKEGVLVKKPDKPVSAQAPVDVKEDVFEVDGHFKKRGNRTTGATYRVHMQNYNLYITVNRNKEGKLVEVFATVGESKKPNTLITSGVEDSWAEGLAKMVSLALRAGVRASSIVRNLKNIPSDKPVFVTIGDNLTSELVPSPPHAIARIIEEECNLSEGLKKSSAPQFEGEGKNCEECGSTNTKSKSSTCYACLDCGYEACG